MFGLAAHPALGLAVTSHEDRTVRLWDLAAGTAVHGMVAHESVVSCVDFDPSGTAPAGFSAAAADR